MAEQLPEARPPRTGYDPIEPSGEVAKKNIRLAVLLFAIAVLMAGGAVLVSFIYLHFD
jgi:hypothetical protein